MRPIYEIHFRRRKIISGRTLRYGDIHIPPTDAADQRIVTPRLPDAKRVKFDRSDATLNITPDMDYTEVAQRLDALRETNRAAALAPYAAHERRDGGLLIPNREISARNRMAVIDRLGKKFTQFAIRNLALRIARKI